MARNALFSLLLLASASALRPTVAGFRRANSVALRAGAPQATALPTVGVLAGACTLPTLLGFWRTEYGVSYAYGGAMAACGMLALPAATASPLARAHALALVVYGVRLNGFLLYRELAIPRFQKFRDKIEARSKAKGGRLKRAPFVLGCSFLYYCMAAPLLLTASAPTTGTVAKTLLSVEVALMYLGLGVAAVGDLQKTLVKRVRGQDTLVTGGLFRWLRHPNYTGELLLWGASALCAFTAAPSAIAAGALTKLSAVGWLAASAIGYVGIGFVLMQAATGLEQKQKETYGAAEGGGSGEYEAWVATSWAGPTLPPKK